MRLLLAGLFVYATMMATFGLISSQYGDRDRPWWTSGVMVVAPTVAMLLAMFLFNRRGFRPRSRRQTPEQQIAELESQGMLLRQSFQATRAFGVEELEDEGLHYYIELVDGRVLYLNGQYLYEYEPITDDPPDNRARSFPCTEFEILRHKEAGYVIDIICAGRVLEPELVGHSFTRDDYHDGIAPEDGQIISDRTYADLLAERCR